MRLLLSLSIGIVLTSFQFLEAKALKAGAAILDITPPLGVTIIGGFAPYQAKQIHDPLHVRAMVLQDGERELALVVCDVLGIPVEVNNQARKWIEEETGIPFNHVLLTATHTHSGPNTLPANRYNSDGKLTDYQQFLARRIADAVRSAQQRVEDAEIAFAQIDIPEHLNNRRWYVKNGNKSPLGDLDRVMMNPPRGSDILLEPAGPIDPQLSFFVLRSPQSKRLITLFASYPLHYIGDFTGFTISADYFGYFNQAMSRLNPQDLPPHEQAFIPMLANGTSGDINNVKFTESSAAKGQPYSRMKAVAEDIAAKVQEKLQNLEYQSTAPLFSSYQVLEIARLPLDEKRIAWAKETQNLEVAANKVNLSKIYAQRIMNILPVLNEKVKVPVQYMQIGEIGIGAMPCEVFAETGLEFKKKAPKPQSFLLGITNGYIGYLPPSRHLELGGYETWPGTNQLQPGACEILLNSVLELANSVQK